MPKFFRPYVKCLKILKNGNQCKNEAWFYDVCSVHMKPKKDMRFEHDA